MYLPEFTNEEYAATNFNNVVSTAPKEVANNFFDLNQNEFEQLFESLDNEDIEIIDDKLVTDNVIEKDANILNKTLEDQIAFDQNPEVPTIDIDFEEDDKKILSDDNASEIEIIVQGESWVEIIDHEQILLFELLQTGLYEVTGYGPFKFKIGHSPSVKIYLNGKNIDFSETVSQYTDYAHFLFENGVVVELFKD